MDPSQNRSIWWKVHRPRCGFRCFYLAPLKAEERMSWRRKQVPLSHWGLFKMYLSHQCLQKLLETNLSPNCHPLWPCGLCSAQLQVSCPRFSRPRDTHALGSPQSLGSPDLGTHPSCHSVHVGNLVPLPQLTVLGIVGEASVFPGPLPQFLVS
jgi:hypothetical protein